MHENINESKSLKHEKAVGWMFHYFTGITLVLTYPALYLWWADAVPNNNLLPGLIWGFVTALLPWLVLFPGFGWGPFGIRAPRNMRPILSLSIEHSIYGFGMGLVLTITSQLWQGG